MCRLGSGNPEPSVRVVQWSPLPLLPAPPGSPRGLLRTLSPCEGKLPGSPRPEELGAGRHSPPHQSCCVSEGGVEAHRGSPACWGQRAKWELDPRLHRQREGIEANWRAAFPQLSGSLSSRPPTLRPRRACLCSALAPAVFCLTLSQLARAQCPSALWSWHLGRGVLGNSWPWGLEPGSETKGEAK